MEGIGPSTWFTREGAIRCLLRFSHEGVTWEKDVPNRIVPRAGEMIQLDGKGLKAFKVEYVIQQLGNDAVTLYCTVERMNVLGTLDQHGFTKVADEK